MGRLTFLLAFCLACGESKTELPSDVESDLPIEVPEETDESTDQQTDEPTVPDADGDGISVEDDCDDDDASIGLPTEWYLDCDEDGHTLGTPAIACSADEALEGCAAGGVVQTEPGQDCDDTQAGINPDAMEVCDDTDNDCDGAIDIDDDSLDATTAILVYTDADADGLGDTSTESLACSLVSGQTLVPGDCDDSDGETTTILTWYPDCDQDGQFALSGVDACGQSEAATLLTCAGGSAALSWSTDVGYDCDDEDLNASTAEAWFADCDGDGSVTSTPQPACGLAAAQALLVGCSAPTLTAGDDCDDTDSAISPSAIEVCDGGVDNNCNASADDADPGLDVSTQVTHYGDGDGDGFGDNGTALASCVVPSGRVLDNTDCDDSAATVNQAQPEVCDGGTDNDCNGYADDLDISLDASTGLSHYADLDGDTFGSGLVSLSCLLPPGRVLNDLDCDDDNLAVNPNALEICDSGIDNDCDGDADDADPTVDPSTLLTHYPDADGDGFGELSASLSSCSLPAGRTEQAGDCDDGAFSVNPGAAEVCDGGVDNNCNGTADDSDPGLDLASATTYYADNDGDGLGNAAITSLQCALPSGFVTTPGDCDDTNASSNALTDHYPDCDGDGSYADTPVAACNAVDASAQFDCPSGADPVGWSTTAGSDCDDDNPDAQQVQAWFADCDGDGFTSATQVTTCTPSLSDELTACPTTGEAIGGWSPVNDADCDDETDLHWSDCGLCGDPDGDGYGFNCDLGTDCNPFHARVWASCGTCSDSDNDGFYAGCDGLSPAGVTLQGVVFEDAVDCDDTDKFRGPAMVDDALNGIDEDCDGTDRIPSDANGIFVSEFGNDSNPGTLASPVRSLPVGIALAENTDRAVYVSVGIFASAGLDITVPVQGGFAYDFLSRPAETELEGAILMNGLSSVGKPYLSKFKNINTSDTHGIFFNGGTFQWIPMVNDSEVEMRPAANQVQRAISVESGVGILHKSRVVNLPDVSGPLATLATGMYVADGASGIVSSSIITGSIWSDMYFFVGVTAAPGGSVLVANSYLYATHFSVWNAAGETAGGSLTMVNSYSATDGATIGTNINAGDYEEVTIVNSMIISSNIAAIVPPGSVLANNHIHSVFGLGAQVAGSSIWRSTADYDQLVADGASISDSNHTDCIHNLQLPAVQSQLYGLGTLRSISPCIDYGTNPLPYTGPILTLQNRDQDGDPRPSNGAWDVGPDELP